MAILCWIIALQLIVQLARAPLKIVHCDCTNPLYGNFNYRTVRQPDLCAHGWLTRRTITTYTICYSNGAQVRCELSSSDGNFSSESVAQSAGSCVAVCVALERLSWLFGWACRFVQFGVALCGALVGCIAIVSACRARLIDLPSRRRAKVATFGCAHARAHTFTQDCQNHSMTSTSASSSTSSGRGDDLLRATLGDPFLKSKITCNVSSPVPDGDDFDPLPRDRCNSWPLQKAHGEFAHHTSPLIHEEIPEEGSDTGSNQDLPASRVQVHGSSEVLGSTLNTNPSSSVGEFPPGKRSSSRRNAWGNLSYADLITQAIMSTPEKRLTLSQIYDWMVKNVPYFRDKGDSNSSAGWKNSIRHNLSLHSRFMRIQNEGPGKSSWWVIDPDAKPGKSSRRRAGSMEISKKLEKKRGRVRKKMEELRTVNGVNTSDPAMSTLSPSSESSDLFDSGSMMPFNLSPANDFRNRSNSAVSSYSVGAAGPCLSPKFESRFDDWQDDVPCSTDPSYPSDLLESMSHSMSLTEPPPYPSAQAAQSFIYGEEEPTSTSRLHNGSGSGAATKYMVVSQQQQQQQRGRPIANAFSVKGATSQQLTTASNGQVVYQQQQQQQQHMKSEPPPYRDMYSPAVSTASQGLAGNNNRMLRQVLQKSSGAGSVLMSQNSRPLLMADLAPMRHHQQPQHGVSAQHMQQHQPTMLQQMMQDRHAMMHEFPLCSPLLSGSAAAAAGHMVNSYSSLPSTAHSNGQLPTELSEMMYDSEIQCDIDQVIRHELNIAGNLDFSVDNFGNI
ncbi:Forkhead box protein O [Trichinella sp. T6]|nr:Forkhead box protein O [Trichinella sp. T6]